MGVLVEGKTFSSWKAVVNNSKCVERVMIYRSLATVAFPQIVTVEDQNQYDALMRAMAQIDLLTNYLLDINQAEPLESDSTLIDGPMEVA